MSADENLTLKSLQSHLIKTIIGSVVAAIVTGVVIAIGSYYRTSATMDSLTEKYIETRAIVDKHTDQLNKNSESSTVSTVEIKNLESRISSMEKTQEEILRLIIEINSSQKTLVKNSR